MILKIEIPDKTLKKYISSAQLRTPKKGEHILISKKTIKIAEEGHRGCAIVLEPIPIKLRKYTAIEFIAASRSFQRQIHTDKGREDINSVSEQGVLFYSRRVASYADLLKYTWSDGMPCGMVVE